MKLFERILALVLTFALCLCLLAACAKEKSAESNEQQREEETTPGEATQEEQNAQPNQADPEEHEEAEIADVYMQFMNTALSEETQKIEDAINEIIVPEIGVRLHLNYVSWGDYATVLTTTMAGGEQLDILLAGSLAPFSFQAMYSNGMATDITGYLEEYGQGILSTIPEAYLEPFKMDGKLYGFPAWRNYSIGAQVMMRKDVLDELGLYDEAMAMDSWSDYEAIMKAVKENGPDGMYPVCGNKTIVQFNNSLICGADAFADVNPFDNLGDTLQMVYTDKEGNVSALQENEKQIADYQMFARWMQNGYFDPDTAFKTEPQDSLMKAGAAFSQLMTAEYGWEAIREAAWDAEACGVTISMIPVSTSFVTKFCIVIPVNTQEPEAAIKFLDYAYTHAEVMNLIDWGIEGEDYVIDENGVAQMPEGKSTVGYHNIDVTFGNFFLALPFGTQGPDYRERCREILDSAEVSPYLGFAVDTTGLDLAISAINSTNDQYIYSLCSGQYTEELHEEYVNKLYAAGLQEYLDAFQEQLDAWRATRS